MKKEHLPNLKTFIMILIGCFLLAVSVSVFILPFGILSGGVAGIAVSLSALTSIHSTTLINLFMLALYVIGSIFLGKKFALNTILTTILYPLMLNILMTFDLTVDIDPLLASLYAGLLGGAGVGIVFKAGASTGGMDIPPLIINKYTGIKLASLVLITDGLTILLGLISHGMESVLIGFISVWSSAFAIDRILTFGAEKAKAVYVISNKIDEINAAIHRELDRGTTILQGKGGYTKEQKEILLVVIAGSQYPQFLRLIEGIDREAFMIVQDANEVHGNGFSFEYKI